MMRACMVATAAFALSSQALAAPNVTNATQKGSLLIFPDIRIDGPWNTLVRLQNDGSVNVDVKCYWMDGNKNRVDFIIPVTRNQPVWFDARSGNGSVQVNRFPQSPANGIDNPFLVTPGATVEGDPYRLAAGTTGDDVGALWRGPYLRGLLACWAVDAGAQNQVKWNHLSGTATVYQPGAPQAVVLGPAAYEYNAYAFFVPTGLDLEPVGTAGVLNLNGVEYDSCPLYQIGQFTPIDNNEDQNGGAIVLKQFPGAPLNSLFVAANRLAIVGCHLELQQDYTPAFAKLQFDVFNEDEVKFTGAYDCADSWHETTFLNPESPFAVGSSDQYFLWVGGGGIDAAAQNFNSEVLGTPVARYRVQAVKSTKCERAATATPPTGAVVTEAMGILGVQSTTIFGPGFTRGLGTTLASAGKATGRIVWDPAGPVPEGGVR